jgi:hypothetical protein
LREKLLTAVKNITLADSAALWAQEALAAKNRLRNALAFLRLASIRLMLRKLCNPA